MPLPKQVKREAEAADQRIKELAAQSQQRDQDPPEEATDEIDDGAAPEDQDPAGTGEDDQGAVQDPGTDPGEAPDDDHAPADGIQEQMRKMDARLQTLQGMVGAKDRQITQLQELLAGMSQARAEPAAETQQTPPQRLVTKDDEDTFGSDMVDFTRRVAQEVANAAMDELRSEFSKVTEKLQGVERTAQATAQDSFQSKLAMVYPGWEKLDTNPEFIQWLEETPARKAVFAQGVRDQDARLVGSFFKDYAEAQAPAPQDQKQKRQEQLAKQVAPGRSKSVATRQVDPSQPKVWTRSEIAAAYAQKRSIPADEFHKLEKEIAAAQREGRVDFTR